MKKIISIPFIIALLTITTYQLKAGRMFEGLVGGSATGAFIGGAAGGRRGAGIGAGVGAAVGLAAGAAAESKARKREREYYQYQAEEAQRAEEARQKAYAQQQPDQRYQGYTPPQQNGTMAKLSSELVESRKTNEKFQAIISALDARINELELNQKSLSKENIKLNKQLKNFKSKKEKRRDGTRALKSELSKTKRELKKTKKKLRALQR